MYLPAVQGLTSAIIRDFMRILFCNYEYPPLGGGGGVINASLAEELARRHEVTILTSQGLALPALEEKSGVRIVRVPVFFRSQTAAANMPSMLAFLPMGVRGGRELIRKNDFDIINTHFALPTGPVGDSLARYSGLPNVLSVHGGDLYDPSKWTSPHKHRLLRRWVRRLLRRADRVVGQSRNTLENMHTYYDSSIEGIRIPLGIPRPSFTPVSRSDYGFSDADVLLVTVGRLVSRKAIDQLVSMTARQDANTHLLIMGTGPQEESLHQQASELGVTDRVHFLGFVEEVEKLNILRMCDVFVSSSQHEGFGLVFLEAMAAGLPVLCYDHGGQTDFLESDINGYVVPLNDGSELASSCRRLAGDTALRKRMGETNIERVESLFIDRCAEQYEQLFETAISEKRQS